MPILKVTQTESRCGGAGSVAADLAALGAVPVCIGVVGDDANGGVLKERLTAVGADTSGLYEVADRPTTTKERLIGLAQHRHRQQLMRIDQESTEPLTDGVYDRLLQAYREALEQVDIVCLQDYHKGVLTEDDVQGDDPAGNRGGTQGPRRSGAQPRLCEVCRGHPADAEPVRDLAWRLASTCGMRPMPPRRPGCLCETLRLDAAVVTLDREGLYLSTDSISQLIPARPRNVYDVTGAGDAVLATLAVSLAADSDYLTAAHLANIAGGIEVEKFGGGHRQRVRDRPRDRRSVRDAHHEAPLARRFDGRDQLAAQPGTDHRLHQRLFRRHPPRAHRLSAVLPDPGRCRRRRV